MTISHCGGVDIEELPQDKIIQVPFDPCTGLKSYHVSNALDELKAPKDINKPSCAEPPEVVDAL